MSVERLSDGAIKIINEFLESKGVDIQAGVNWMCDIFDALNDDVIDLARLRELVEADRDGRCVVLSCKHGDTVLISAKPYFSPLRPQRKR